MKYLIRSILTIPALLIFGLHGVARMWSRGGNLTLTLNAAKPEPDTLAEIHRKVNQISSQLEVGGWFREEGAPLKLGLTLPVYTVSEKQPPEGKLVPVIMEGAAGYFLDSAYYYQEDTLSAEIEWEGPGWYFDTDMHRLFKYEPEYEPAYWVELVELKTNTP